MCAKHTYKFAGLERSMGIYMHKNISRRNFIDKLKFYLSFYFNYEEITSIIDDYEDWFDNEALQGKSEEEICAALNSPKKVVGNLLSESDKHSIRISILLQNTMIQVLLLIMIYFLISISLLKICNRNALSYLYPAAAIMFIYFIAGIMIVKKNQPLSSILHKKDFYWSNLSLLGFSIVIILFEMLFLPKMKYPNSGEICSFVLSAFILSLFLINIYVVVKKMLPARQSAFLTTLHISGIITLLFFAINQSHMLYNDIAEYSRLIYGSICIYIETIILCFIFYMQKIYIREKI